MCRAFKIGLSCKNVIQSFLAHSELGRNGRANIQIHENTHFTKREESPIYLRHVKTTNVIVIRQNVVIIIIIIIIII